MDKDECRPCIACVKRNTMYCPNSIECFAKKDKPHFRDRMMLLEENSKLQNNRNELKKWLEERYAHTTWIEMLEAYGDVIDKIKELEGNNESSKSKRK